MHKALLRSLIELVKEIFTASTCMFAMDQLIGIQPQRTQCSRRPTATIRAL